MSKTNSKILLVLTTVSKKRDAEKISQTLLSQGLAACVTTLPGGESMYRWKGKLCRDREFVLLIKTLSKTFSKLKAVLEKVHPYDCPEILGIPAEKVSRDYGAWLRQNISS